MFSSKTDRQRVEKKQYKTLQVVYNNCMATYDDISALNNKLKIHQRHLEFLTIEICKSSNKLNPKCETHTQIKISHIHWEEGSPPSSRHKHY